MPRGVVLGGARERRTFDDFDFGSSDEEGAAVQGSCGWEINSATPFRADGAIYSGAMWPVATPSTGASAPADYEAFQRLFYGPLSERFTTSDVCMVPEWPEIKERHSPISVPYSSEQSLKEIEWSGVLDGIPQKEVELPPPAAKDAGIDTDRCVICTELINRGYDIRLGEAGRSILKKEISRILKSNNGIRETCLNHVCRLKNANVLQLIQMAEIAGCLPLALRISADYWREYNSKQTSAAGSLSNPGRRCPTGRARCSDDGAPALVPPPCRMASTASCFSSPSEAAEVSELFQLPVVEAMLEEVANTPRWVNVERRPSQKRRGRPKKGDMAWRPRTSRLGGSFHQESSRCGRRSAKKKQEVEEDRIYRAVLEESLKDAWPSLRDDCGLSRVSTTETVTGDVCMEEVPLDCLESEPEQLQEEGLESEDDMQHELLQDSSILWANAAETIHLHEEATPETDSMTTKCVELSQGSKVWKMTMSITSSNS